MPICCNPKNGAGILGNSTRRSKIGANEPPSVTGTNSGSGALGRRTVNDGANQYAYDARGRMVQSVGALGTTTYRVNALGQRIRKTNGTDDRVFHYDTKGHLIAESDPGGQVLREYLYLNDIPLAVIQ